MCENIGNKANRKILFSPPDISELEINEVVEALKSGWITTGPRTIKLEQKLKDFCNVNGLICLNSATAAEELNLRVLGIKPGDEVIVPAYTYTATAAAAIHCGAKIVFIDSQKDGDPITHSPEMDYDAVEKAINEHTKAIVPVDLGGIMCDYDRLYEIVEKKKELFHADNEIQEKLGRVAIVADCAHSLGAVRNGKKAGSVVDFSSFSFHAVKNFTTAEGGAAAWKISGVNDEELYKYYHLLSLHGQNKSALEKTKLGSWEYDIVGPWYKCNMTDIMSAIGLKQLERYEGLIHRRHEIIKKYDEACDRLGIFHLNHATNKAGVDSISSGHLYLIRIPDITEEERNEIIIKLAEVGIATNVHFKPLPMMTAYKELGWDIKDFPNAYDYYQNLISLPLHTLLSDDGVEYIISKLEETLQ